uniref:Core-2/I-branching beta-1,6-N-acetylglucosaminyltransferase family protein n=1 Tax=Kalanchoe fedtschenkoi TaxID=63787 RepID=A0A7N0ZV68_KALFE
MFSTPFVLLFTLLLSIPLLFLYGPHILSLKPSSDITQRDELADIKLFRRAALSSFHRSAGASTSLHLGAANPKLKIAFMFLINSDLAFAPLWEKFFETHDGLFNIYIHCDPAVEVRKPGGVFQNRFIDSKPTRRGSPTLISAARRLLATAILDDSTNFYFALLSQSCVPLHSFNYVYSTLFSSPSFFSFPFKKPMRSSYIEILSDEPTLPDRYVARGDHVMLPEVRYDQFKIGSQFFVLNRKHALSVIKDRKLWRKFKLPCLNVDSCYPEEHYFPTLLAMEDKEGCSGYTLTRVNWTASTGGHPHTYYPDEVSADLIHKLRASNFSSEYLFARKFAPESLMPLMEIVDSIILKD